MPQIVNNQEHAMWVDSRRYLVGFMCFFCGQILMKGVLLDNGSCCPVSLLSSYFVFLLDWSLIKILNQKLVIINLCFDNNKKTK